ncbi:glycosyltransferase family 2 protein [Chryseobacterium binzhouense]|uniref:glycosyltransferase family 2 protein n=1 Tax=Chryseobacterium binzhouense TaxID=2593646 RepID=UPI0011811D88|nr:glycosyltransferase family 2 protein [Chryseobacterium binzhouense]
MKISVCIPVYNFDVRELITDLKNQIEKDVLNAEIILIDDASDSKFKQINQEISKICDQVIFLEKNIGRSKIRNLFLQYAKGDYLLFLDCDGKLISENFMNNYFVFLDLKPNLSIVYGGRTAISNPISPEYILRWKFASERENLSLIEREKKPYLSFQTNNFLISRKIFKQVQFNTSLNKYGYEDLIFAMDLKSLQISVDHIENPVLNDDIESNKIYLKKVEESIENLAILLKDKTLNSKLSEIKIVKAYQIISTISILKFAISKILNTFENSFKRNLLSSHPNLRILDFYKLGLLLRK